MMKTTINCICCKRPTELTIDPESYTLFKEGRLNIQTCFPELNADEREMLLSGFCPTCWDDMIRDMEDDMKDTEPFGANYDTWTDEQLEWLDETEEFDNTRQPEGRTPTTFWQALKVCWNHRHSTTVKFEWFRSRIFIQGMSVKLAIKTTEFPINYGTAETTIWFHPTRMDCNKTTIFKPIWRWFSWNSEHIASLMGREEIDGPGPGYGSTYHYEGWLGYHLAI